MLDLINIVKSFPRRGIVLNNLNLSLSDGETIAVNGPSGSGKSTLLNIIGSLDRPDSGDIIFRGRLVPDMTPDQSAEYRNRNIGFVFQDHLLLPHLTVKENILLPLFASGMSHDELREKTENAYVLAELTGIASLFDSYPYLISGGEAQRAALVRSLVNKPSLLLADEPTGSLDSNNADLLGKLLIDLNKKTGITLIVATHSNDLASVMSRHYKLEDGVLK